VSITDNLWKRGLKCVIGCAKYCVVEETINHKLFLLPPNASDLGTITDTHGPRKLFLWFYLCEFGSFILENWCVFYFASGFYLKYYTTTARAQYIGVVF